MHVFYGSSFRRDSRGRLEPSNISETLYRKTTGSCLAVSLLSATFVFMFIAFATTHAGTDIQAPVYKKMNHLSKSQQLVEAESDPSPQNSDPSETLCNMFACPTGFSRLAGNPATAVCKGAICLVGECCQLSTVDPPPAQPQVVGESPQAVGELDTPDQGDEHRGDQHGEEPPMPPHMPHQPHMPMPPHMPHQPHMPMSPHVGVIGQSPYVVGQSPPVIGQAQYVIGQSPYVLGQFPYVVNQFPYVVGQSPHVVGAIGQSPHIVGVVPQSHQPNLYQSDQPQMPPMSPQVVGESPDVAGESPDVVDASPDVPDVPDVVGVSTDVVGQSPDVTAQSPHGYCNMFACPTGYARLESNPSSIECTGENCLVGECCTMETNLNTNTTANPSHSGYDSKNKLSGLVILISMIGLLAVY